MRRLLHSFFFAPTEKLAEGTLSCWLFLRGLGLCFLTAFLSLWPQVLGLIGSRGMMPEAPFLKAVTQQAGAERWKLLPTLFYFGASDNALRLLCAAGVLFSLLLCIGVLELWALVLCWACYLSFVSAGRDFLSFQWDSLLLESALCALPLLLSPSLSSSVGRLRPALRPVAPAARWLLFLLLLRFMFAAGWAKLRSGDSAWRDLSALDYHFFTQPLPTVFGYYAHQLPAGLKAAATFLMFVIELGVPFLILIPPLRRYAFMPLVGLQLGIAATGNYGFFNLLTIVLCIPLLPDAWVSRILPQRLLGAAPPSEAGGMAKLAALLQAVLFTLLVGLSAVQVLLVFVQPIMLPPWLHKAVAKVIRITSPFHMANRYGLFAVMTRERPEIILEGSRDGTTWLAYDFKYKVGALSAPPHWNAPHQPRLDWQMWFAALGSREEYPWFSGLCIRLLQGSPDVLSLLARDPFAGTPPRFLRATLYQYSFTSLAEHRQTGNYFRRQDPQPYMPAVSLEDR